MDMQLQRPITSGSRQAPDPYDQYLESRGLYRKHTARDASSLFRVIAEQMYDTQMLHYEIRLECVRFMTLKRRIFEKEIPGDFDSYMQDMSKPKTYGTMTELRAMSCLYRRNVILYEPFNMGTSVIFNRRYAENFRVFFNNENHFDSVYDVEYIERAAICQSIAFKLLYQKLFKLPDVSFAVEIMLHPHTFNWDRFNVEFDDKGYMVRIHCTDGRVFKLDLPMDTNCILENYKLCNFHSTNGNQSIIARKGGRLEIKNQEERKASGSSGLELTDMLPMCPNRLESCVRQLLDDGISPFPYKVAKSMDPNMYRNIEFDCWNDMRKEAKLYNVYINDYNFKVGAKCKVELPHETEMYTCHVQNISKDKKYGLIFVETIGKKIVVPYESLHPMPPEEYRPWSLPYRYHRQMPRMPLPKFAGKANKSAKWKKNKLFEIEYFESTKCDLIPMQGYMPAENCYHQDVHIQDDEQRDHRDPEQNDQNPATEQRDREEPQAQQQHQRTKASRVQPQNSSSSQNQECSGSAAPPPPTQYMNYVPMIPSRPGHLPPPWPASPIALAEEFQFPISGTPHPPPTEGCVYMPFGGYAPPPPGAVALPGPHPFMPLPSPPLNVPGVNEPRRSLHLNGDDLPVDIITLRHFYNMGVDLHWRMTHHTPPDEMAVFGYHQQNNTDQQAGKTVITGATDDHLTAAESTPPPSPEVANATEQSPLEKNAYAKRNLNPVKVRGKRPEQLQDIKDSLGPAAFLPTPTPSPSSNGSQFSFYTTPSPHHHLITPPRLLQPPPPQPIFFHKAGPPQLAGAAQGQNPYAWGMPAPVVSPYEVINNYNMDPLAQPQQQQAATLQPVPSSAQSQPAAVYAAPRHH
ncbi:protein ovarian tumor locus isoform X1 [Drosophila simulans]|nr:protein ovarian tumor locus isoform X1 [Drosophila simulans]XP_039152470.1 protein ovarian tumor locus isoform X1 [Drosophila simulans]XP_039152471.1 protein ovarian tumor locus isoform X1 [Drosophila simulans]XP_039152472.1 protein ovarian tumor locus isoform X1 [Drosophila simulans]KMZ08791.1 otu, isoform C [Drosophila simulans]KMZ08792.1 otu, isoform D [Drosophila simulans]KMZ08794.1 otu, isoform F [Drosophila simulans]KMZ08795.1 otu, isoform G [Drosophila simulans]